MMRKVPGQAGKSAGGSRPASGALTPRQGWDGGPRVGPAQWAHGWEGTSCRELEPGPAEASLGQGLTSLGSCGALGWV